jgi:hypothetical protein
MPVSGEPVNEPLELWQPDLSQMLVPELGQQALAEVLLVAADRARL